MRRLAIAAITLLALTACPISEEEGFQPCNYNGTVGYTCDAHSDCRGDLVCWAIASDRPGRCVEPCPDDARRGDACGADMMCADGRLPLGTSPVPGCAQLADRSFVQRVECNQAGEIVPSEEQ